MLQALNMHFCKLYATLMGGWFDSVGRGGRGRCVRFPRFHKMAVRLLIESFFNFVFVDNVLNLCNQF
jgi:hypothetical protein